MGRLIAASALREDLALAALLSVSAIGLALAFPRTDWDGVAWLLVVPVIVTALSRAPRVALGWGWFFGTVFFLVLLVCHMNVEFYSGNGGFLASRKMQVITTQRQLSQLTLQPASIDPQIDQRAEKHVAADS